MGNGEQGNRGRQEERLRPRKKVEPQFVPEGRKKGWPRLISVEVPLEQQQPQQQSSEEQWQPAEEHQSPFRLESFSEPVTQQLEQPLPQPQWFE